ncbi:MAG: AAA family ATPase [Boseongicola sp.]|nr:AAA family ATPase [Boseongicola sp.]
MTQRLNSTLLLIEDEANAAGFDATMRDSGAIVATENATLRTMNGRAQDLVSKHDVVIFETDPDDPGELSAIDAIVGAGNREAIFIALTAEDVSITKARRLRARGVDEVLPKSIDADDLNSIVSEMRAARSAPQQTSSHNVDYGSLITVAQSAGGSGATTTAVNLATALAAKKGRFSKKEGASVALIDLDIQFGSVGVMMDLEDNGGFLEMVESAAVPDISYLKGILQTHDSGVDVLVAPRQIVPVTAIEKNQIATMLDVLRSNYDYVVVDLPRALVEWLEPIVSRMDELVIVSDTSVPSMRQAKRLMDFYREDNITVQTKIVINRESKPLIKSEQISEGEKLLETKFTNWLPDNVKVARKSADLGRPVVTNKPGSDLAKSYFALAKSYTQKAEKAAKTVG